jgi:hypothetical protein
MIRTLRITSIVAGLLAVALLVVFSMVGVKPDPELEKLLRSPSVVEQYVRDKNRPGPPNVGSTSRLDELAKGFARMINPPAPSTSPDAAAGRPVPQNTRQAPPRVSGKFKLLATSFSAEDPNLSLAFVEMPTVDQKRSWVRVGQSVEREGWTIRAIKDGAIVYGDEQQTQEILVEERAARVSLLDTGEAKDRPAANAAPDSPRVTGPQVPGSTPGTAAQAAKPRTAPARRPAPQSAAPAARPALSDQNMKDLEKLADQLRTLKTDANDNPIPPDKQKLKQEAMEMLVNRLEATRAARNEANAVSETGQGVETVRASHVDSNQPL